MKKGFTLIELLSVIAILAIIILIALPSLLDVLENAKIKAYQDNELMMNKAAENYLTSNRELLPQSVGETVEVTLNELKTSKYISEVSDSDGLCNGYILVTKLDTGYEYLPHLECSSNYESSNIPQHGLIFNMPLGDSGDSYNYYDIKNGNDGMKHGTELTTDRFNQQDKASLFNGTSDYISLADDIGYIDQFSVFAWFKSEGNPAGNYHIVFGGSQLEISIHSSGYLRTGIYTNARYVSNHGSGLVDNNWHFVGFTYDGEVKKSYIDSFFVGSMNTSDVLNHSFSNRNVGKYGSSNTYFINGKLSDLLIYNRVLNEKEIAALYESTN